MFLDFYPLKTFLKAVQRLLSAILLVCFGVLTPLQAVPARLCLLENKLLLPGFDSCGASASGKVKCCVECDASGVKKNGEDCCVDVEALPDTTAPAPPEKLPALTWVILPCDELPWLARPAMAQVEAHPLPPPFPVPIASSRRQSVLSVWTV